MLTPSAVNGGVLCGGEGVSRVDNALYDLISAGTLDGLLVWSSCLDWSVRPQGMQVFCDRFRPLPLVSIGRTVAVDQTALCESIGRDMAQALGAEAERLDTADVARGDLS